MQKDVPSLFDDKRANKSLTIACLIAMAIVPLVQSFRGLDITDTGWVLTNERLIFSHPERITYWFHLWLTNVVGGLVDLAFGRFGILPHKIAAAVIFWATAGAIYYLYRRKLPGSMIVAAMAASMAFGFFSKINVVHYNNVSALLYVLGAALLCEAATSGRRRLFFLSGFVLALNAFARAPNVIGLGLILVPWILGLFIRDPEERFRLGWKDYALFAAGALAAAAAALIAMALLGQLGYYVRSLFDLTDTHSVDAGSYTLGKQVKRPLRDILGALKYGLPYAAAICLVSAAISVFRQRLVRLALLLGLGAAVYFFGSSIFISKGTILYAPAGVCYWAILALLIDRNSSRGLKLASALSACMCLALNVGSDTGINVSSYLFPAMLPALIGLSRASSNLLRFGKEGAYRPLGGLAFAALILFAGESAFMLRTTVYRDTSAMTRTARVEQLACVFTRESRAAALEEALPRIAAAAPPGSVLFAYDSLGLFHFATRTLPYLDNPWPALYEARYMERLLREKEKSEPLPPVLMAKRNPRWPNWPENSDLPVNKEIVMAFLDRNRYRLEWESASLALYLPPSDSLRASRE